MTPGIEHVDQTRWRELAPRFQDYSYRQLWGFGVACAERVGAASEHVAVLHEGDVIGLADVRIKRVPMTRTGIAYVNGGPLVRRGRDDDSERLRLCLEALIQEYVRTRGLVLRVLPPLGPAAWNGAQAATFSACGFGDSTRADPYRTMVLSLAPSLDEIRRQSLAQKWRNCLNRAEKNGLTVRTGADADLFERFCGLYRELINRKEFSVDLDAAFYARVQRDLTGDECFVVSLVDVDGEPAAGHVSSMLGDTCVYLLGASNEAGMKSKASYLLQWQTIRLARERGCLHYDLGGIDPEGNPGVFHFKSGLGGVDITGPGPFETRPAGLEPNLVFAAESVFRFVHRLRADKR